MEKNELCVMHGKEYAKMACALMEKCDVKSMIPSKTARIGIKPNLLGQIMASEGGTTHPEVVEGIICYLQEAGYGDIVILESSWVGDSTQLAFEYCGYTRLSEKYHVPLLDLQKDEAVPVDCAGMELSVCKSALGIDFLINVPVLKGHCQTKMTCALKNMKGLIPGSEKRRFHRLGLHEPIAHLSAGVHQDLVVVDCICPDLTFEDGGDPVSLDRLIAAADPVLCDAFGCRLLGLDPGEVAYISLAQELGVGNADPAKAVIRSFEEAGEEGQRRYAQVPWDEEPLRAAASRGGCRTIMQLAENVEEVESCSACYAYLIPALEKLEAEGLLSRLKEKIAIGQGHRGQTGPLGVGQCTSGYDCSISGCPAEEDKIYEELKAYILANPRVTEPDM